MTGEAKQETHEFTTDSGYFGWVQSHPYGFVLSVRGKSRYFIGHRARTSIGTTILVR